MSHLAEICVNLAGSKGEPLPSWLS